MTLDPRDRLVADSLGELEAINPDALRLAELASLAAMIEPVLLRRLRVSMDPQPDASAEADLWLSSLVESAGPRGFVLIPEISEARRRRLTANLDRLNSAWTITRETHARLSPALRLEEEINWLRATQESAEPGKIQALLGSAVAAMIDDRRPGVANWAARALSRLPVDVQQSERGRVLRVGAEVRLFGDLSEVTNEPQNDIIETLSWLAPTDFPRRPLVVRLLSDGLELGCLTPDDAHVVEVPDTNPLLIEVSTVQGDTGQVSAAPRRLLFKPTERHVARFSPGTLRLRDAIGAVYELRPDPFRPGISPPPSTPAGSGPNIGISYSAVAAEAVVELGCARAFVHTAIRPSVISGVGAGALVAVAHALDVYSGRGIDMGRLLQEGARLRSLGDNAPLGALLHAATQRDFSIANPTIGNVAAQSAVKLRIGATSWPDGAAVWLPDETPIDDAVVAASALPGLFPPRAISAAGHSMMLVAGSPGTCQPLVYLVSEGCDTIYACSVSGVSWAACALSHVTGFSQQRLWGLAPGHWPHSRTPSTFTPACGCASPRGGSWDLEPPPPICCPDEFSGGGNGTVTSWAAC